MEVNGDHLKRLRMKIRRQHPGRGSSHTAATGTQEWLASEAQVSLRSIQKLENREASENTLEAVCSVLGEENWRQYIVNRGQEYVVCKVEKHVDFRPSTSPNAFPDRFSNSVMMLTVDPLSLCAEAGNFDSYQLKNAKATLSGLKEKITFSWLAEVLLTEEMSGWLGKVREIDELTLEANNEPLKIPIMFRQEGIRVSWEGFVQMVESSENPHISITLELEFSQFTKKLSFAVCADCLKRLFITGREVHDSPWPHRAQVPVINPAHE